MTSESPFGNIYEAFATASAKFRNRTAVIYLGTRFSYNRIMKLAENFAASLCDQGVGQGERIILYIPNCLQWVIAWLGIQRIGAVAVPITPIYTAYDLEYIANDSEARFIVCADINYGYVKQVLPETGLNKVIVTRLTDLLPWWKRLFGWAFDKVPKGSVSKENDEIRNRLAKKV